MRIKIIAFEGPDCVGKQTQSEMLTDALNFVGVAAIRIETPYNDQMSSILIKKFLHSKNVKRFPTIFQTLQTINKLICQKLILSNLQKLGYEFVVFDRWKMSSHVYGIESGANKTLVEMFNSFLVDPDVQFIFYGNSYSKEKLDVYEKDTSFQKRIKECYKNLFQENYLNRSREDDYLILVDNKTTKEIHEEIKKCLKQVFPVRLQNLL